MAPQAWGVSMEGGSKMLTGQHIRPSRTGEVPRIIEKPCHVFVPACTHIQTNTQTQTKAWTPMIPVLGGKLKASFGFIVRHCLREKKQNQNEIHQSNNNKMFTGKNLI